MATRVLCSLIPLIPIFFSWRFMANGTVIAKPRKRLFRSGIFVGAACSILLVLCWIQPFPLVPDGHGGYSGVRETWLLCLALFTALLTFLLAAFGRGAARLWLLIAGSLLVFLAYWVFLENGV
jgi:hypothetical protein